TAEVADEDRHTTITSTQAEGVPAVPARHCLSSLDDLDGLQVLVHLVAEAGHMEVLSHVVVVRHACEEVVAARRDRVSTVPFAALEVDVAVLLPGLHRLQQGAETMTHRVLGGEGDEYEAHAHLGELIEGHRGALVEPLEGRRVVEREARLGEALADLLVEAFGGAAFGGRELAPEKV